MGEWVYAQDRNHKCDYPKYAVPSTTRVGDIWQCKCGEKWIVSEVQYHPAPQGIYDPRETSWYTASFIEFRGETPKQRTVA